MQFTLDHDNDDENDDANICQCGFSLLPLLDRCWTKQRHVITQAALSLAIMTPIRIVCGLESFCGEEMMMMILMVVGVMMMMNLFN